MIPTKSACVAAVLGIVLLMLGRLPAQDGPGAEEAERARVEKIRKERAARERSLKENFKRGDIEVLRKMKPEQIVKMQIFAAEYPTHVIDANRTHVKQYLTQPFGGDEEDRGMVAAVLKLLSQAEPYKHPGPQVPLAPALENRVLVVQPVEGEPVEFMYNDGFHTPFASLASRDLKEALYALSGGRSQISIIHMVDGKVQETINQWLVPPNGGVGTQRLDCGLRLTPEKGLSVAVKLRDGPRIFLDDEQPLHYGEAKTFTSKGPGTYVVLLAEP